MDFPLPRLRREFIMNGQEERKKEMKCKRCLAQVPDHLDVCPNCGQDLASLRQLLKNFNEEPNPFDEPDWVSPQPGEPSDVQKENPARTDQPRVIFNSPPDEYTRKLALHEPLREDEAWEEEENIFQGPELFPGGFWLRSLAFVIDLVLLFLILATFLVVGFIALEMGTAAVRNLTLLQKAKLVIPVLFPWGALFGLAYFTFCQGAWGQTLGKRVFGLQVLRKNGNAVGFGRALARTLLYIPSAIPLCLGFLWIALSPEKRAWHDGLAGTIVIRE